jgi:hypothetical protein
LHEASHCDWLALLEQSLEQCPSQSLLQDPSQLKFPPVQPPLQLLSQVDWQFASMVAVHWPLQLASSCAEHWTSTLIGVQFAVHPPDVSIVHVSFPEKSMSPHD